MGIVLNEVDDTTDEYVYASQQLRASGE
jgi:hypothetical protein